MVLSHLGFYFRRTYVPEHPPDAYFRGDQQKSDQPSWYSLHLQPLVSLCLVSRRLCHIAQPFLYSEFMLGYGDSWRSDLYTWDDRLASFMKTIARRRDLAALVKRIYIHPCLIKPFEEEEVFESCYYPGLPHSVSFIEYYREDDTVNVLLEIGGALRLDLQQLSSKDLIAVLIAALPNLEHYSVQLTVARDQVVVTPKGLQTAGISCLPLNTIDACIRVAARDTHSDSRFLYISDHLGALLDVSMRLETLNLHMCRGLSPRGGTLPCLPNLKNIRLTYSRLDEPSLEGLLSCCKGLRSFSYEATSCPFSRYRDTTECSDHFYLTDAVRLLTRHRETLESVHIDLRKRGQKSDGLNPRAAVTFKDFDRLTHLFLNMDEFHTRFWAGTPEEDSVLLTQLLPSSIKSLHLAGQITDERPRLEKSLLDLARAASNGRFKRLEEVLLDEKEKFDNEDIVSVMLDAVGCRFGYDSWPMTKSTLGDGGESPRPNYEIEPFPDGPDPDL